MYAIFARETLALFEGNEGKLAAQAGHAYLHAYWDAEGVAKFLAVEYLDYTYSIVLNNYRNGNDARKIALVVDTVSELISLRDQFENLSVGTSLVEDCGYTVFKEPTITCLGIGPVPEDMQIHLAGLKLLRHELAEA